MSFIDTAGLSRFAGKIKDNFATNSALNSIGTRVNSLEQDVGAMSANISSMSNTIGACSSNITALSSSVASINGDVAALQNTSYKTYVLDVNGGRKTISLASNNTGIVFICGGGNKNKNIAWFYASSTGAVVVTKLSDIVSLRTTDYEDNWSIAPSTNQITITNIGTTYKLFVGVLTNETQNP